MHPSINDLDGFLDQLQAKGVAYVVVGENDDLGSVCHDLRGAAYYLGIDNISITPQLVGHHLSRISNNLRLKVTAQ